MYTSVYTVYVYFTQQINQNHSHLDLFLAENSEDFGLIIGLLRQTEMTKQNRIHPEK